MATKIFTLVNGVQVDPVRPSMNFSDDYIRLGNYPDPDDYYYSRYIDYLDFNFKLPENGKINKVTLKFTPSYVPHDLLVLNYTMSIGFLNHAWDYKTITYNNKISPVDTKYFSGTRIAEGESKEYNITDLFLNNQNNTGITIKYTESERTKSQNEIVVEDAILILDYVIIKPNTPSNLSPNGISVSGDEKIRLSWNYEPLFEGDNITDSEIKYSVDGISFVTINQDNDNLYYDFPAKYFATTNLYWKVRVKGINQLWSEESNQALFQIASTPSTPIITSGTDINLPRPVLTWNKDAEQVAFRIIFNGFDTREITGINNSYAAPFLLENNKTYTVKLAIKNKYNLWSDYAQQTVNIAFDEPGKPTMHFIKDDVNGILYIDCNKTMANVNTLYFDVYRKEINQEYIRIATNIQNNYIDSTIKPNTIYYYKIRAVAGNEAYKDSDEKDIKICLKSSQIQINYDNYINLPFNPSRNLNYTLESKSIKFAGREKPISEFGEQKLLNLRLEFKVLSNDELEKALNILYSPNTLLYRDNRNRKIYCTANNVQVIDQSKDIEEYNISFDLIETDYTEVV